MKALLASSLVIAIALPLVSASGETNASSDVAQESLARIRAAYPYSPAAKAEPAPLEPRDHSDPAVMMERLTVVRSFEYRQLQQKIERETQRKKAETFSAAGGGLLWRSAGGGLEIGSWEHPGGGLTFLRLAW